MDEASRDVGAMGTVEDLPNLNTALDALFMTYHDARARANSLRATALVSLAVLSAFAALAGPQQLAALGFWGWPDVALVVIGLVSALAVLLPVRVSIPYDSALLAADEFLRAESVTLKRSMVGPLTQADKETRDHNKNAAWLVSISLSCFVAATIMLSFQIGLGDDKGLVVGVLVAILAVGLAHLLRWLALDPKSTPKEGRHD